MGKDWGGGGGGYDDPQNLVVWLIVYVIFQWPFENGYLASKFLSLDTKQRYKLIMVSGSDHVQQGCSSLF